MPDLGSVEIKCVERRSEFNHFVRVPWAIYAMDLNWVPPLISEFKKRVSKRNPYFQHARWRAWVAYRNGRPVGRISAQIDDLYLSHYKDATGFFGLFESHDDPEVIQALLSTAENWLWRQGMQQVIGPFNLSINQECGLLVEGYESPPAIMMGHARPYYHKRLMQKGYLPVKDLLTYRVNPDFEQPQVMQALTSKYRDNLIVRSLRRKYINEDLEILRDIFNDAWSQNWGFVPFTKDEFRDIGREMLTIVSDDLIQIAEFKGEPVAMIVAMPNLNEVIKDMDGRLLPLGWLRILWMLKVKYPKSARVPLMGVRRKYQYTRLGSALAFVVIDAVRKGLIKRGVKDVELSWILEDNAGMRNILEAIGSTVDKRYRLLRKPLGVHQYQPSPPVDETNFQPLRQAL